jgi:aspartate kinase
VALAAVLGADACEIYTDVDGVYTTDPRVVPDARKMDRISYDEMLELASLGAGVMHSRSIEFAKKYGVPIHVRGSFTDAVGTWIVGEDDAHRLGVSVTGAALIKDEARVTVLGVPDRPGVVHELFRCIGEAKIVVDMIVQNVATNSTTEVSFTVAASDLGSTLRVAEAAAKAIGASGVSHDPHVSKVSVVGLGMRTHTGVAELMFRALADDGINIEMITTSEIKISVLVAKAAGVQALRVVHRAFALDQPIADSTADFTPRRLASPARGVVSNDRETVPATPGMEDLVISDVVLDTSQARVTIVDLPNTPGHAARVFQEIARAQVFVDMIVQTAGQGAVTNLSFTVPREDAQRAAEAAARVEPDGRVLVDRSLAKLSVTGVGMRTHTGVATHVFGTLAKQGINIELISTSEVRINVITQLEQGDAGVKSLREVFFLPEQP